MKKVMAMALALTLIASLAIGGTSAYYQDAETDVNVMTTGRVKIQQHEQERSTLSTPAADSELVEFTQAKPIYPAVGPVEWAETGVIINGTEYPVYTDELRNVIDKIVTVENTGRTSSYVRTVVAIEAPEGDPKGLIHINANNIPNSGWASARIHDTDYIYTTFTYSEALLPKTISAPSLLQVFLDAKAGNEDCEKFGESWDILVMTQAVQTDGFADAATALDTAFGKADAANVATWFADTNVPFVILSQFDANEVKGKDGDYLVGDNFHTNDMLHFGPGTEVALDLNGKTITADKTTQYAIAGPDNSSLTLTGNGNVDMGKGFYATASAQITVESGTFNASATGTLNGIQHHSVIQKNAKFVINGGTFTSSVADAVLFFVTGNGTLEINGGFFENTASKTPDLLSMGTSKSSVNRILLRGGTFVNWNPLEDKMCYTGEWPENGYAAFGGPWIIVMDGYKVVSETQANGDVWYSVVTK